MKHFTVATLSVLLLTACVTEKSYVGSDKPVVEKKINNEKAARTRIALALKYLTAGDSQQAKFNLERALKFAPELTEVHYTLAYYYQQVGENELAKKAFQDALKIDRDDPNTLHNYGTFLCRVGEFEQLRDHYRKSELKKLQREIAQSKSQPKIKVIKKKAPPAIPTIQPKTEPEVQVAEAVKIANPTVDSSLPQVQFTTSVKVEKNEENQPSSSQSEVQQPPEAVPQLVSKIDPPEKTVWDEDISASSIASNDSVPEVKTPYHIVEKGENLFSISVKYNVKLKTLLEWNDLKETDQVMVGSKVYLNNPKVYHVVADGETLFSISVKYNILMAKLIEWNNLGSAPRLHPGKKLILVNPITYRL